MPAAEEKTMWRRILGGVLGIAVLAAAVCVLVSGDVRRGDADSSNTIVVHGWLPKVLPLLSSVTRVNVDPSQCYSYRVCKFK